MAKKLDRVMIVGLSAVVVAGLASWLLFPTLAETEPNPNLNTAMIGLASEMNDRAVAPNIPQSISLPDAAELSRLSLSRQSFRRGGLGSKALMTFTVRNANAYPVKDLEIACAFRSRDGGYTTERRRTIAETIDTKSRKAFPMMLMGFVNVRAEKARCSLVTASRA